MEFCRFSPVRSNLSLEFYDPRQPVLEAGRDERDPIVLNRVLSSFTDVAGHMSCP